MKAHNQEHAPSQEQIADMPVGKSAPERSDCSKAPCKEMNTFLQNATAFSDLCLQLEHALCLFS